MVAMVPYLMCCNQKSSQSLAVLQQQLTLAGIEEGDSGSPPASSNRRSAAGMGQALDKGTMEQWGNEQACGDGGVSSRIHVDHGAHPSGARE